MLGENGCLHQSNIQLICEFDVFQGYLYHVGIKPDPLSIDFDGGVVDDSRHILSECSVCE